MERLIHSWRGQSGAGRCEDVKKGDLELAGTIVGIEQGMADDADLWNGHAASRWIEMLDHPNGEVRWQAIDALRHIERPEQTVPLFAIALRRNLIGASVPSPLTRSMTWRSRRISGPSCDRPSSLSRML